MRVGESDMTVDGAVGGANSERVRPALTGWTLWRGWRGGALLVLLCLSVYLPGFTSLPAVDRDESRFAQASRQMFESGDFVVPRVQGRPRLNKPPLIYWMQSASAWAFTGGKPLEDRIWMYRVPSLIAALVAVLATWRLGLSMAGPFAGFLAAAILAVSPVFFWEAHQARADMVLVACTVLSLWGLWRAWSESLVARESGMSRWRASWGTSLLLWVPLALGVLTKGPITPMVIGLGVLALCVMTRRWRWLLGLRPVVGILIVLVIVVPWLVLVTRQVGFEHYVATVRDETLGRSLEPKEGHSGFPGYHTLLAPLLLFPGSVFIGLAVWDAVKSIRAWRAGRDDVSTRVSIFLLCTIAPTWLVLEVVGTKLPHYTMPLYPALAILTARACCIAPAAFSELLQKWPVRWAMTAWLIALPAFIVVASILLAYTLPRLSAAGVLATGIGVAAVFLAVATWCVRNRNMPVLQISAIMAFVPAAMAIGFALPRLKPQLLMMTPWASTELARITPWISTELAANIRYLDPGQHGPVAAVGHDPALGIVGFHEDSLVFEMRGRIERIAPADLDAWFAKNPGGFAVMPASMLVGPSPYLPLASVEGFNYSKGRLTYLCIAERRR